MGQGPSCDPSTDDSHPPQSNNCSYSNGYPYQLQPNANQPTGGSFDLTTHGIKVTYKNACRANTNALDQGNWNVLITQLVQGMHDYNYFAAVILRCRLTVPNIAQFGMDICPDEIDPYGPYIRNDYDTFGP